MIRILCPTGCGSVRRPFAMRTVPVRCDNCTAWLAAPATCEDGALLQAILLARPGERLPASPVDRPGWTRWAIWALAAAVALALVLALTRA